MVRQRACVFRSPPTHAPSGCVYTELHTMAHPQGPPVPLTHSLSGPLHLNHIYPAVRQPAARYHAGPLVQHSLYAREELQSVQHWVHPSSHDAIVAVERLFVVGPVPFSGEDQVAILHPYHHARQGLRLHVRPAVEMLTQNYACAKNGDKGEVLGT
eukprot:scaffold888_cov569-Prasinococcus_capsulatus_cf.AAC.1